MTNQPTMTFRRVAEIHPCATNAKKHDQKQIENVAASIREFGFLQPLVVSRDGEIAIGHCRYEAARLLGLEEVPVIPAEHLDERQLRALRVLDNKLNESPWDAELLAVELDGLDFADLGLDVDIDADLGDVLGDGEPPENADDVPEVDEEPDSVSGCVYALGNHRLMCGDSTSAEDVARLMGGERADVCFTSPPYNMARNKIEVPSKTMEGGKAYGGYSDDLDDEAYAELLGGALGNALAFCDDAMFNIGILSGSKQGIISLLDEYRRKFCDILVWKKDKAIPLGFAAQFGQVSHSCELIFCFNANGTRNFSHPQWGRAELSYNVIETENNSKNEFGTQHHAAFPVSFAHEVIRRFTEKSVLDLFGGTGTTLIAAETLNRQCRMMELDPHYCDVIRRRWAEFVHGAGCDWRALTPMIANAETADH